MIFGRSLGNIVSVVKVSFNPWGNKKQASFNIKSIAKSCNNKRETVVK